MGSRRASTSFELRVAAIADEAAVSELLARSYPVLLAPDYPAELLARALPGMTRAQPALLGSGTFYLAIDASGRVRGCGGWTAARPGGGAAEPELAHLRHFATDPAFTRRGVGRAIVARCLADAAVDGRRRFECDSTRGAVPFYAAVGFEVVETIAVDMGGGLNFPGVRMRLD